MSGRPPKPGPRYPSGKLKPKEEARVAPAMIHRVLEFGLSLGADVRLTTELGRLLMSKQVTALEAGAGFRMAEVYGAYERFHGISRKTRSPSYEMGIAGAGGFSADDHHRARQAFDELQEHLATYRRVYREALERLCVEDCTIGHLMLTEVRPLLARMARNHFRTTRSAALPATTVHRPPPSAVIKKRRDVDRECIAELVKVLRPDLSERISEVSSIFVALKDRAAFRAEKEDKKRESAQ